MRITIAVLIFLMCLGCAGRKGRVCWTAPRTGNTHCGQEMPRKQAKAWVDYENSRYPELHHRVESVAK